MIYPSNAPVNIQEKETGWGGVIFFIFIVTIIIIIIEISLFKV